MQDKAHNIADTIGTCVVTARDDRESRDKQISPREKRAMKIRAQVRELFGHRDRSGWKKGGVRKGSALLGDGLLFPRRFMLKAIFQNAPRRAAKIPHGISVVRLTVSLRILCSLSLRYSRGVPFHPVFFFVTATLLFMGTRLRRVLYSHPGRKFRNENVI